MAECKNYVEGSLRISLLDEYNYRLLESGQPHDEIDTIGATSYLATRALDRGHYYIVLQNTSEIQEIVVKVKASLSYTQADMTPCSQAAPAPCPDLNSNH
jgi:hypothetical protein